MKLLAKKWLDLPDLQMSLSQHDIDELVKRSVDEFDRIADHKIVKNRN